MRIDIAAWGTRVLMIMNQHLQLNILFCFLAGDVAFLLQFRFAVWLALQHFLLSRRGQIRPTLHHFQHFGFVQMGTCSFLHQSDWHGRIIRPTALALTPLLHLPMQN